MRQHYRNYQQGNMSPVAIFMMALAFFMSIVLSNCSPPPPPLNPPPKLIIDDSVARDFRTLAQESWELFLTLFQARTHCFGDVYFRADSTLSDRATYDPDTATVTIKVPGTPAMLQGALVHEWAHHIEFQCEEHKELRPPFLEAQGLPPDTPWRGGHIWAEIPSEQYAEATIDLVLGRRNIPTEIRVSPEAIRVIETWAMGD